MLARVAAQPLRSPLVTGRPSGGRFESQAEDVFGSACVDPGKIALHYGAIFSLFFTLVGPGVVPTGL